MNTRSVAADSPKNPEPEFIRIARSSPTTYLLKHAPPGVEGSMQRLGKWVSIDVKDVRTSPPRVLDATYWSITDAYHALWASMPDTFSADWVKRHAIYRAGRVAAPAPEARVRRAAGGGVRAVAPAARASAVLAAAADAAPAATAPATLLAPPGLPPFLRDMAEAAAVACARLPSMAASARLVAVISTGAGAGVHFHTPSLGVVACADVAEDLWVAWALGQGDGEGGFHALPPAVPLLPFVIGGGAEDDSG